MLSNLDKCIVKYKTCFAGDVRTALCLRDNGVLIQGLPGFNKDPPHSLRARACQTPYTFHHLLVHQIQEIWNMESQLHSFNRTLITASDIYRIMIGKKEGEEFMNDIDMPGADIQHMDSPNAISCQTSCRNEAKCISFSYVDGVCWLKDSIVASKTVNGSVSGFFSEKYVCNS